jgi:hypothetical protein
MTHIQRLYSIKCSLQQATWITKANRSRDIIYDGVKRSSLTAGYDTIHAEPDPKSKHIAIKGPCIRQQLKPCKADEGEMQKYHYQIKEILGVKIHRIECAK